MGKLTNNVTARISAAATDLLRSMAKEIAADIKSSISTNYPPSSKPGEPPHKRSGKLRRSIKIRTKFYSRTKRAVEIYSDSSVAPYNLALEEGSKFMSPRPFMAPARKRAKSFARDFESRLKRKLRTKKSTGIDAPSLTIDTDESSSDE